MKIQRKIPALLCCLTFIGTLSFDALSAQAALCKEHIFSVFDDERTCYEEDGHYTERGLNHICVNCGYQYWNGTYYYEKTEDHEYLCYKLVESTDEVDIYMADCETPECPYTNVRCYLK